MIDNIMVSVKDIMPAAAQGIPVSSGTPVLGMNTSSVPEGAGGNGSSTANFAGLLQTIISGLDKGTGNLDNGTFINADGKTVSLAELMQKLFIDNGGDKNTGPDKKTDSGNSMADMLQQMIAQLQASVAQPVVFITPGQSVNTASSDTSIAAGGIDCSNGTGNSMTALIAALETALQKSDLPAASGETPEGAAAQQNLTDIAANNAGNQTQGTINDITTGADGTALSSIAQQNLTDNAGTKTSKAIDGTTTGVDGTSLGSIALQNLTNYAGRQMPDTINTATLNAANNAGNQATNAINAAVLNAANNAGNPTTNAINSATLNAKSAEGTVLSIIEQRNSTNHSENATDTATPNTERSTLFASVSVQQTQYAENAKPVEETLPVSRLNELSGPIMKTLGSGDSNLTIKLSPPDMGTIQIKLKMENGILTADFKVDSTAVKDMFATVMPQIKQSIESSGIKTGNFFTDLKEDSFTDGRQQDNTNQQQQKQQKEQKSSFFDFFA